MSQIDLKHAIITIKDGYAGAELGQFKVNNVAGYAIGAITMLVDNGTGIIATGLWFTVVGDTVEHQVTAHTETTGNTTSITFTPALAAMVADNANITILAHRLEVNVGEGNCSWAEKRNMEYKLNRGKLGEVRQGDEAPVEVKLDFVWDFLRSITGATTPTIEEALKKLGAASAWVSSDSDLCRPYAIDIEILYTPPCTGEQKERITLNDYRYEQLDHDPKAGTLTTSGKCNVTQPTVVREA